MNKTCVVSPAIHRSFPTHLTPGSCITKKMTSGWILIMIQGSGPIIVSDCINLSCFAGTSIGTIATIGTIKPHFENRPIISEKLGELSEPGHLYFDPSQPSPILQV